MATLKHNDSGVVNERPLRSCVACCDSEESCTLVKPCRNCSTDFCKECLVDMFVSATTDRTRMPPRCCSLIQIHTVIGHLTTEEAQEYRHKFEEWITPAKTYCPKPACSAFISERLIPQASPAAPSLKIILTEVLAKISLSASSRFCRGEPDITQLAGFTSVIKRPIDLTMMKDNIDHYTAISQLTDDMRLIVSNAVEHNGQCHPVTLAAHQLFKEYTQEISKRADQLILSQNTPPTPKFFACPECHISICTSCKEVEHSGKICDTTAGDHEIAMLAAFGYKRCPRCKAGVKKMFGCPHMQCVCGAHWCYYCQRSGGECDGSCEERGMAEEEDEEEYDSEEDESDGENGMSDDAAAAEPEVAKENAPPPPPPPPLPAENIVRAVPTVSPDADFRVVNLDRGGDRRWAETNYDFGEEPEEEPFSQVWSCKHRFYQYEVPAKDGINRGDLDRMECNRCFTNVKLITQNKLRLRVVAKRKPPQPTKTKDASLQTLKSVDADDLDVGLDEALECSKCRIVICRGCRVKYAGAEA